MSQIENWNSTYENNPNLDTGMFLAAASITSTRYNTRRVVGKEHRFDVPSNEGAPGNVYEHQGLHKQGSAVAYVGSTDPTTRPDGTPLTDSGDNPNTIDDGRLFVQEVDGLAALKYRKQGVWKEINAGMTGIIAHFPKPYTPGTGTQIDKGWLLCDGSKIRTVDDPRLAALIVYLAGTGAAEAWLPRMTDTGSNAYLGRVIIGVGSDGEETYNGQQSPKLVDPKVGYHNHTLKYPTAGPAESEGDGKWKLASFTFSTKTDGAHTHSIDDSGSAGGGSLTRLRTWAGSATISSQGSEHTHSIEVNPTSGTSDMSHTHIVDHHGSSGDVTTPPGICLYPFIHI